MSNQFNKTNEGQNISAKRERDDDGKTNQPVVKKKTNKQKTTPLNSLQLERNDAESRLRSSALTKFHHTTNLLFLDVAQ